MKKLEIPCPSERIRGITLPEDGHFFVCDYDEVFKVPLHDSANPEILDDDPYEFLDALPHSLGVYDHPLIHASGGNTIKYYFDGKMESVNVMYNVNGQEGGLEFRTFSGDWFAASFSKDGKFLVLAEPYDFEVYELS